MALDVSQHCVQFIPLSLLPFAHHSFLSFLKYAMTLNVLLLSTLCFLCLKFSCDGAPSLPCSLMTLGGLHTLPPGMAL